MKQTKSGEREQRQEAVMNSFQKWADDYARAFGFIVSLRGNWVELHRNGETTECMSAQGVQAVCSKP